MDLRLLARRRVPRMFYEYVDSGSWTESTYRANERDFQSIGLRQRVAVNIEHRCLRTQMLGQDVAMPVALALAPTGLTGMQHADGEMHAARAAQRFGVPFTLSTMSICSIEDVAQATAGHPFWFQLYVMKDRGFIVGLRARAKAVGCSTAPILPSAPCAVSRRLWADRSNCTWTALFAAGRMSSRRAPSVHVASKSGAPLSTGWARWARRASSGRSRSSAANST
jgi:isopentenyl diphosphate isomerase/L-lactate dehydrogenase-like FMN-dependent dehydrogenase